MKLIVLIYRPEAVTGDLSHHDAPFNGTEILHFHDISYQDVSTAYQRGEDLIAASRKRRAEDGAPQAKYLVLVR